MKVTGLSDKALRFEGANDDLPIVTKTGVLIRIIEIDNRLHVLLEVGENTRHNDLRDDNTIWLARQWRDRLLEWQGPWLGGGDNAFYYLIHQQHRDGKSYAQIAKAINKKIADYLHEYFEYIKEYEAERRNFRKMLDFYLWKSKSNPFALYHASDLLRAMRVPEESINEILREGLTEIMASREPFPSVDDYPISKRKVERSLRTWRDGDKHRILVDREEEYPE